MKTVIIKKDEYIDNSVRVSFYEKDALIKVKTLEYDEKLNKAKIINKTIKQDNLLYCTRLEWNTDEFELSKQIEELKHRWEIEINS